MQRQTIDALKRETFSNDNSEEASQFRSQYLDLLLTLEPKDQLEVLDSKITVTQLGELDVMKFALQNRLSKVQNPPPSLIDLMAMVQLKRIVGLTSSSNVNEILRDASKNFAVLQSMLEQLKEWQQKGFKPTGLGENSISLADIQRMLETSVSQRKSSLEIENKSSLFPKQESTKQKSKTQGATQESPVQKRR